VKPVAPVELAPEPPVEEPSRADAAGLYFPPTTAFPIPREDREGGNGSRESRRAPRRRPTVEPGQSKRSTEPAEPGDEGTEVSWMAGLSNRLSAYSLSDEEPDGEAATEADEDVPPEETSGTSES
jgi:hypothetical protein